MGILSICDDPGATDDRGSRVGHLRSNEIKCCLNLFSSISRDTMDTYRDAQMVSNDFARQAASSDAYWLTWVMIWPLPNLDLTWGQISKLTFQGRMKTALQCFFRILPSYHTFGDNSDCSQKKNVILSKLDLWWHLVISILVWPKNDLSESLRSRRGLLVPFIAWCQVA